MESDIMAMTIKELYEYARAMGRENYKIRLQYQDGGGLYDVSCEMENVSFDMEEKTATLD